MALAEVRYKGGSDVREITRKQLKEVGIEVSADLVWERKNLWKLRIDLNDELEQVLRNEGSFTISAVDDQGKTGEKVVEATVTDDTVTTATVVDATTGQKSQNPEPSTPPTKK